MLLNLSLFYILMLTLRQISLLSLIIIVISCNQSSNTANTTSQDSTQGTTIPPQAGISDDSTETLVANIVFNLPEVKERAAYIEKQTDGKRHLKIWISQTTHQANSDYYQVNAGEDNGASLVAHFNFYIHKETFEVKYYDVVNDTIISIADWRKQYLNHD